MRLSEAIRLGSLAIQNPEMHNSEKCAIGMGLCAVGKLHKRGEHLGMKNILDDPNHIELRIQWPWVTLTDPTKELLYKYMPYHGTYEESLYDAFDQRVMHHKTMTLEVLCDTVAQWERDCAAKGINVEQVTMAAELNQPASPTQSVPESASFHVLEQDVAK